MNYFYEVVSSAIYRIKKVGIAIQLFLFISYEDPESLLKTTALLSYEFCEWKGARGAHSSKVSLFHVVLYYSVTRRFTY